MQRTTSRTVPVITTGRTEVVSCARTTAGGHDRGEIGVTAGLREATGGLWESRAGQYPGRVLVDVAVAITGGAVTVTVVRADREDLPGRIELATWRLRARSVPTTADQGAL